MNLISTFYNGEEYKIYLSQTIQTLSKDGKISIKLENGWTIDLNFISDLEKQKYGVATKNLKNNILLFDLFNWDSDGASWINNVDPWHRVSVDGNTTLLIRLKTQSDDHVDSRTIILTVWKKI